MDYGCYRASFCAQRFMPAIRHLSMTLHRCWREAQLTSAYCVGAVVGRVETGSFVAVLYSAPIRRRGSIGVCHSVICAGSTCHFEPAVREGLSAKSYLGCLSVVLGLMRVGRQGFANDRFIRCRRHGASGSSSCLSCWPPHPHDTTDGSHDSSNSPAS